MPLLERLEVVTAPSLRLFFQASARLSTLRGAAAGTVVAVGDPTFERELFTDLTQLAGSAREARAVGGAYSTARVLIGADATRAALFDAVRNQRRSACESFDVLCETLHYPQPRPHSEAQ